jgi:uncharacterized protein (DUF2252 family)
VEDNIVAKSEKESLLHDNTMTPRDDRRDRGKVLRASITRESHAGWKIPPKRPDPIDIIEKANETRRPELIELRHGRMLQSPFTFYRGTAGVMAADLATTPTTNVKVQTCGDCHLQNFGAFATPERNIVFDINDFDETLPAPWEWDLKRLSTSFVLLARDNGLKPKAAAEAAEAVARSYRQKTQEFSHMSVLDIWYYKIDWQDIMSNIEDTMLIKNMQARLKAAQKRSIAEYYYPKMTEEVGGKRMFKDQPPTLYHLKGKEQEEFEGRVKKAIELYKESLQDDRRRLFDRYKLIDVALKVVGIGSVGTTCGVALMYAPDDEPLMIQLKEATASVLEPFAGKSEFKNHGQRVVAGQRIMQAASDIFLGWSEFDNGKHFYLRQLRDTKVTLETSTWEGQHLVKIAEVMGAVLAKAHARSGDSAVIDGYLGTGDTFDRAIVDFSLAYADQAERDHAAMEAAVRSGRMKAATILE